MVGFAHGSSSLRDEIHAGICLGETSYYCLISSRRNVGLETKAASQAVSIQRPDLFRRQNLLVDGELIESAVEVAYGVFMVRGR